MHDARQPLEPRAGGSDGAGGRGGPGGGDDPRGGAAGDPGRVVVGITGASGAIYGLRLLRFLLREGFAVDAIVSPAGRRVMREETDWAGETLGAYLERTCGAAVPSGRLRQHSWADIGADIASGSVMTRGMIVAPCSMGTLSGIATGRASNLIERAADVTMKEGRRLVLVPRETPLHRIHLENMLRVVDAGAHLVPAMPAFYFGPRSIDELADFVVGRALALLGIEHALVAPWVG